MQTKIRKILNHELNANINLSSVKYIFKNPFSYIGFCYLVLLLTSYQGSLNIYPLGQLSTISISAILFSLTTLTALISFRAILITHMIIFPLIITITISSWYYFDYFRELFTYQIFNIGWDIVEGGNAVDVNKYKTSASILVLLTSLFTLLFYVTGHNLKLKIPTTFVFCTLMFGIAGIITVNKSIDKYSSVGSPWLKPANLHPVHAFLLSINSSDEIQSIEMSSFEYFDGIKTKGAENLSAMQTKKLASNDDLKDKQLNLIIILLESFRADLSGSYDPNKNKNTPWFDRIANQNILARTHYSNTTHTVSAEMNIWCGIFDKINYKKIAYLDDEEYLFKCLPEILAAKGYHSFYFHGNKGDFYNRNMFIPKVGFDSAYFHKDKRKPKFSGTKIGWGVDDISMFKTLMDQLEKKNERSPFFAHLTTLSNHYPFMWDVNIESTDFNLPFSEVHEQNSLFKNYQNSVYYSDYALGKFWQAFEKSDFYENTVVVLVGDHGIWEFENDKQEIIEKNERFFRSALAIYHPNHKAPKTIDNVTSHIDLTPTILNMLDINYNPNHFLGRDIMKMYHKAESWAIMAKGANTLVRKGNLICYHNEDECSNRQQRCYLDKGQILSINEPKSTETCINITGDILGTYTLSNQPETKDLLKKASLTVLFQNKTTINNSGHVLYNE